MPPRPSSPSAKRPASPRGASPKKRPPKSGGTPTADETSEELFERFGPLTGVSRTPAGSSGLSISALQEQLAESQKRQFEQHVALESMRQLLEQAQLENTRLTSRCAALCAKLGETVDEGSENSTERVPTGDEEELDPDQLVNHSGGMGLQEIAAMLRPAPDPLPLDASKVFNSLPVVLQDAFDERSVDALDTALRTMPPYEAHYHMQRCVDSSLWEV